jgi:tetratricopeptide (TPR) repeat protein
MSEEARSAPRVRVPIAPAHQISPVLIGVDPAAQTILPGDVLPDYVHRLVDDKVGKAVEAALDGIGSWLVVVAGRSKVGKSRTLLHALGASARSTRLQLVAPVDVGAIRSLPDPAPDGQSSASLSVLWLDDLEPFFCQGLTLQTLRDWQAGGPGRIVAATHGGRDGGLTTGSGATGLSAIASEVLQHAHEISLEATTEDELATLGSTLPPAELAAVLRLGLAAYLISGAALEAKMTSGRHQPGDDECPPGLAILGIAVDWVRCGRMDSVSEQVLRGLLPDYLPSGVSPTDEAFEVGLEWSLRPVAGATALLQGVGSYRANDFAVWLMRDRPDPQPPRESLWLAAIQSASDAQALEVGLRAWGCSRLEDAAAAFELAWLSSNAQVTALAGFHLYLVLGQLGRPMESLAAIDKVVARFGEDPAPALRERVARALLIKGATLGDLDRFEEAAETLDEVVARFGEDPAPALRERVGKALLIKGIRLAGLDRFEEAAETLDELVERFGEDPASLMRDQVAEALGYKAIALGQRAKAIIEDNASVPGWAGVRRVFVGSRRRTDGAAEALAAYDQLVDRFSKDPAPALRKKVARALLNKGATLGQLGRSAEAVAAYDQVVDRFAEDPALAHEAATALAHGGATLMRMESSAEADARYDALVDRFSLSQAPPVRQVVAQALLRKSIALGRLDLETPGRWSKLYVARTTEALALCDRVVDLFGGDPAPGLREWVAHALIVKGDTLLQLDRSDEALKTYQDVIDRFGEDPAPALRNLVALVVKDHLAIRVRKS